MKKVPGKLTGSDRLRHQAEQKFKKSTFELNSLSSESDIIKLNQELSIHQIELEIQNEELKNNKEKLEVAVERYTQLYEFAPLGYITLSRYGEITGLNLTTAKMLGKERRFLINLNIDLFVSYDTKAVLNYFLNEVFESRVRQSCELSLNVTGTIMSVYLIGLASDDGTQCEISMIDITERKVAEEKLKSTLKELTVSNQIKQKHESDLLKVNKELEEALQINVDTNRFISILAHDLRSPFSVILGYSELLSDKIQEFSNTEIEKLAKEINKSTRFTFTLLEDLLKWARMQSGRIPFKPLKLKIKDIWHDLSKLFTPVAEAKDITINFSDPYDIEVVADIEMLKAILRNLISNAIKYTRVKGFIKVTAEQTTSDIIFSVCDNGIGIKSDSLKNIFNLSELNPTAGTAGEQGTGLGLFLCKGFVAKHGGKIWAESRFSKGSIFYFTLPASRLYTEDFEGLKSVKESKIYNLKVLIAEDNESLRIILGEFLKKYSREILYASTGVEAVAIFKQNPDIDLIMMDFFMPEMNGYETTRQIRLMNNKVIIFVETSDTFSNITEEFAGVKINDFFPKPYNRIYLNELIIKHFADETRMSQGK